MSRGTAALDRIAALVVGLVLVVGGAALVVWRAGWVSSAPDRIRSPWLTDAVGASWWPWALVVAGIVLVLLGVWWLVSHVPQRGLRTLRLGGSEEGGTLSVDTGALTDQLSQDVAALPGVRSARTRFVTEEGRTTVVTTVIAEPAAGTDAIRTAGEQAGHRVEVMTGRDDVAYRMQVVVATVPSAS